MTWGSPTATLLHQRLRDSRTLSLQEHPLFDSRHSLFGHKKLRFRRWLTTALTTILLMEKAVTMAKAKEGKARKEREASLAT
jgi:hypothetical protein